MTTRRFAPLFWCQFFSAFSDNFLKNALVFLLLFKLGGPKAEPLITLAAAVFIAPFFFLSGLGGELADRFDKALVAQRLKLAEIGVAAIAVAGFWLHSVPILFVALFLFGVIAALFGPIKYGILPDHLAREELPAGNALVEGATFMAILLGTIVGGLAAKDGGDPASFALADDGVRAAVLGREPDNPADRRSGARPARAREYSCLDRRAAQAPADDRRLWWGAMVVSWFWLVGAVVLSLLPPLVKNVLGGTEEVVTAFLAIFSIAIAVGSGPGRLAGGWAHHPPAHADRRRAAGHLRARSRLGDMGRAPAAGPRRHRRRVRLRARLAHHDRSRRPRHRGRPFHRAVILGGAGLGGRRPARARGRRRQCAQCRPSWSAARSSSPCCRQAGM